jgi:hypothetical protein
LKSCAEHFDVFNYSGHRFALCAALCERSGKIDANIDGEATDCFDDWYHWWLDFAVPQLRFLSSCMPSPLMRPTLP